VCTPPRSGSSDSVEGNGYPHTVQLRKLHCEMKGRDPKGGALGGYSLNTSDTESARIHPDLPAQEVFILPLRDDPQNVLRNDPEVLSPKKNKVIVRPADLVTAYFLRRVSVPVQKLANHSFSPGVTFRLNNLVRLRVGRHEIDLGHDLRGGLRIKRRVLHVMRCVRSFPDHLLAGLEDLHNPESS
jgi:hypothetical protein